MKKQNIETTGIVAVQVEINHSEMIVLKGFVKQVEELNSQDNPKPEHMIEMLNDISKFLNNVLPENVMSLEEAYVSLFNDPNVASHENLSN